MLARLARPAVAALAASTLLTACSSARYASPSHSAYDDTVQVEVTNHNWMDMNVYALRGGTRIRLGTVTTGTTQRFKLPSVLNVHVGDLRLMADPIGSGQQFHSDPILVEPGTRLRWSLENQLALSSFMVVSR